MAALRRRLQSLGLDVTPVASASPGLHPLWVDLGRVKSGTGEALQLDQHAWWRRTGEAAGSALGWASGSRGIKTFGALGAELAERFSHGISAALGNYHEVIIAAPNVTASSGGPRYAFVLGMYTDSAVAIWGDRALRYGYGKQGCWIDAQPFRAYSARIMGSAAPLLSAQIEVTSPWRRAAALPQLPQQLALMSQPLLGHLGGARFALSGLERDYSVSGEARVAASTVRLSLRALPAGLADREHLLAALAPAAPWGAFSISDVPTRVTYPRHVTLNEL
jgi:hypothetical protein